jgi:hypothetical protein
MDRDQEETIQRVTARYVSESRAGLHPRLSDYLSLYPQYADMIADFVTYYHAIELDLPEDIGAIPPLSQASRAALDEAWQRVSTSDFVVYNSLISMQKAANDVKKSFTQLAVEINLSQEILKKLDQHGIDPTTIPRELCLQLAKALHRSLAAVETYLGLVTHKQLTQSVAENSITYHVEDLHVLSFQEAIEQSQSLTDAQKVAWNTILDNENL